MTYRLVLLRHGQSIWNLENRFSGWEDVDLTPDGEKEAINSAKLLVCEDIKPNFAFTSVLKRAIRTLWILLDEMNRMWIPVERTWKLNERHYGALQGLNKAETAQKHGEAQVLIWRRSYDIRPPALSPKSSDGMQPINDYLGIRNEQIPTTECLKDTVRRVTSYWKDRIIPEIKDKHEIIIVAHGNSLRGLVKHIEKINDQAIVDLNIPTGIPLVYNLDKKMSPISRRYLGDPKTVEMAVEKMKNQGKV